MYGEGSNVEIDETAGDKDVDYREGVRDHTAKLAGLIGRGEEGAYLRMKLYASPGGGASMMMTETSQCSNRPINGALRGLLLAQSLENGRMPSRPTS